MREIIKRTGLIVLMFVSAMLGAANQNVEEKVVIAYLFSEDKTVNPEMVAAEKMTHINYAFANIKDGKMVTGFKFDEENFRILNSLKNRNRDLKILISVGGWTWSGDFSDMALTKKRRKKFIDSAVDFVRKYKLDGIDVDWEYPGLVGYGNKHRPADKKNFTHLLKGLREVLNSHEINDKKHYITSIAVGAFKDFLNHTEMDQVQKYLDFVNIMTYDMYESEADVLNGHHTALFHNPDSPKAVSTNLAVKLFLDAGVPKDKIVIGSAFYGRAWTNVHNRNHGLFQKGKPVKMDTSYKAIKERWENKNGFERYWDETAQAPFLWNESSRTFISYDDDESVSIKCDYIKQLDLRGIMFWSYDDDYQNELLEVMHKSLLVNRGCGKEGNNNP